jgi:hypothetical protein
MFIGLCYGRAYGTVDPITKLIAILICLGSTPVQAQDPKPVATVQGIVVDARTGLPLPRILVAIEGGPSVETNDEGRFSLVTSAAGTVRVYVSAVGYGLVQRTLQVAPDAVIDLTIPLSEGAATYTETVTVSGDRFRRPEAGVPAQHTLGSADLQNLRGVVTDDALRAVQVLPGVATGDDFRSEFSVRGSDFSHMNFTVDGFATPFLMHMVRAVEDRANTGSVAMINSDVLEEVTLASAAYVQRSGNRTGAELSFAMREGSRDRSIVRASVSGTSASVTVEGPAGRTKRGSWLVSGRKSYLDLLIDKLSDEGLSFGFADVQGKLRYDLTTRQSVAVTVVAGQSRLREVPEQADETDLFVGNNGSAIVIGTWRSSFRNGLVTAGLMGATNEFDNHTIAGVNLEEGTSDQLAARADVSFTLRHGVHLESGLLAEYSKEFQRRQRVINSTTTVATNEYGADSLRHGGYARFRLDLVPHLMIAPGARVDHWQLTDQTTVSPWMQSEVSLPKGVTLRAAGGLYQQFPDFEEVVGSFGGRGMRAERAVHADVSIEHRISAAVRFQLTLYNRHEDRMIRRPAAETRLASGQLIRGSPTASYANQAEGYARGVELLLQRSSPTALSGWLSYAYGRNRYEDTVAGESYWGDLDQRHTLNAYAFYRFSHRLSVSAKLRTGSNFPVPGYYRQEADRYFVTDQRNTARLPAYARLDLRANRTFDWTPRRLTLFVEVLNVLNRENVRFNPPRISTVTREVTRLYDSLVPVVPSAGVLFEF